MADESQGPVEFEVTSLYGSFGPPTSAEENSVDEVNGNMVPSFDAETPCGEVFVEDPQKESGKYYTSFVVKGIVKGENWMKTTEEKFETRKRYTDFVRFRELLVKWLPGVILPALPTKRGPSINKDKFDKDFLEERRAGLQMFLTRLFHRAEICLRLPLVLEFLMASREKMDEMWQRPVPKAATICKAYSDVFRDVLANNGAELISDELTEFILSLRRQIPQLKEKLKSASELRRTLAAMVAKERLLGGALCDLVTVESGCEILTDVTVGGGQLELRDKITQGVRDEAAIRSSTEIWDTLVGFLARQIKDVESALDALADGPTSVPKMRRRLVDAEEQLHADATSYAQLSSDWLPSPRAGDLSQIADALTQTRMEKLKRFVGRGWSSFKDGAAQAGFGTEGRKHALYRSKKNGEEEVEALKELVRVCCMVVKSSEVPKFRHAKEKGCQWAATELVEQSSAMYQAIASMYLALSEECSSSSAASEVSSSQDLPQQESQATPDGGSSQTRSGDSVIA